MNGRRSTFLVMGLALAAAMLSGAWVPTCTAQDLLPVNVRGDTALRWSAEGKTQLFLSDHVELQRGTSRLEADRVLVWIDEKASAERGKVVMEVYAEGSVRTTEQGVRATSQCVFFRWEAASLTVDDADGFIAQEQKPFTGPFFRRAEEVRSLGAVPVAEQAIPPKAEPPVATLPPAKAPSVTVVEPTRIGLIYGQQQGGPDIKTSVQDGTRVTIATRYPDIVFFDPGSATGTMEVLAENIVIWVNEDALQKAQRLKDAELEIYAEGRVVIYKGPMTVQCEQFFYDYKNQRGLMVGGPGGTAAIKTFSEERKIPLIYRAKEFRQVSEQRYLAKDAILTTSEFALPEWGIYVGELDLISTSKTVTDELGRTKDVKVSERAQARNVRFVVEGMPLFYWPRFTHDLKSDKSILKSVRFGSSSRFGFSVWTEWGLYDLGIYENDWSDLRLLADYYSRRGPGLGLKFLYGKPEFWGEFLGYTVNDTGTDRNGLPPEEDQRSRVKWFHRQLLSEHWRLDAELSWINDRNFLNEFFEREFKEGKEQESLLYLRYLEGNRSLSLLGKWRLNDFQTQTEAMPEARFVWLGEPLFGGPLTYLTDTHFGNMRRRFDDDLQRAGLAGPDYRSWRLVTEHELQYPFRVGIFNLNPFVNAAYSWYDEVVSGEQDRVALTAGIRTSTDFWRIYDVYNRLLDINRLRHVVTPTVDVFYVFDVTKDPAEVHQFDALDMVDEATVVRFGLRQRLQTKRLARTVEPAAVGGWYNANWMVLDLELDWFPRPGPYNDGHALGPLEVEYLWQVTDRLALLANADLQVNSGFDVDTFDVGLSFDRSPKMTLYVGQRYIGVSDSNILVAKLDYKIDERWTVGVLGQFDFGLGEANDYRVTLRRRLHRWIMEMGYEYDVGENNHTFMLMFWPQGVPEAAFRFF